MINTEKMLEFNIIKEKLAQLSYMNKAKEKINNLKAYLSESELRVTCVKQPKGNF